MRYLEVWTLLLIFTTATSANAAHWYVRAGAEGDGQSPQQPVGTLAQALTNATRADTIHIAQGIYTGPRGAGMFPIMVPHLKLIGGYNPDFTQRNPFQYHTVLQRDPNFAGDTAKLPDAIIQGYQQIDHTGLTLDGLIIDGRTRNVYKDGKLMINQSFNGALIRVNAPNLTIRNCVLLNTVGPGIYNAWQGNGNRIENCLIANVFVRGIDMTATQPDANITVNHCTIALINHLPIIGGGTGIELGHTGNINIQQNLFACIQTDPAGRHGFALANLRNNKGVVMQNNLFDQTTGGAYLYQNDDGKLIAFANQQQLISLSDNPIPVGLAVATDNTIATPQWQLPPAVIKAWQPKADDPSANQPDNQPLNWQQAITTMTCKQNVGFKTTGPFDTMLPAPTTAPASQPTTQPTQYRQVTFKQFSAETQQDKPWHRRPVQFHAIFGPIETIYPLADITESDYRAVRLMAPPTNGNIQPQQYVLGYLHRGSKADIYWRKLNWPWLSQATSKPTPNPEIIVFGHATTLKLHGYEYPVAVVIDRIEPATSPTTTTATAPAQP